MFSPRSVSATMRVNLAMLVVVGALVAAAPRSAPASDSAAHAPQTCNSTQPGPAGQVIDGGQPAIGLVAAATACP